MTPHKLFGWLGAVAIATTMTAGCSQTDVGITTSVKSKLAADDTVKANRIDVDTKDKVVTLKGEVQSEVARNRAIEIAKATTGVRDVVDVLMVAPPAAATTGVDEPPRKPDAAPDRTPDVTGAAGDAGITSAVKTQMLADTAVSGLKIDVDTSGGVVTLTGNVSSAAEKRRALEIARKTTGVKSVKDQLKVVK